MKLRLSLAALVIAIVALWSAYVVLLGPRIGWVPSLFLGLLGAAFLLVLSSGIAAVARAWRRSRLLARAESGPLRKDGYAAWAGRAVAAAEDAQAPLSGDPCLLWEYELRSADQDGADREWSGIGQVPFAVESRHGSVLVRAGVLAQDLDWRAPRTDEARERALALAARDNALDTKTRHGPLAVLSDLERLLNDTDGDARIDWRRGPGGPVENVTELRERLVRPGETVCVFGRYSMAERAFVPSRHGVELFSVRPDTLRKQLRKEARDTLFFALVGNLLIQTIAVLSYLRGLD